MKCLLFIFTLCFSCLGWSAESLSFDTIRLNELAKLGYTQILESDFIADDAFNQDLTTVTVYLKNKSKPQIKKTLENVITAAGYDVVDVSGIVRITKRLKDPDPDLIPFFYKPKYREVNYLSDMVSNIFKVGAFTYQRKVQSENKEKSSFVGMPSDSGTTAFSQISKPTDAFIFNGTKNEIIALQSLLQVLDVPENQVQLTGYLYEVSNSDNSQSSLSIAAKILGGDIGLNLPAQFFSNFITFSSTNFSAAISALSTDSRFKVISSPSLLVKNRQKGSFSVGADVPILGQVTYQKDGQPVQSVEYKPSGVILDFSPVFTEKSIELTIHHQLSNFVQTTNGVNASPTLLKRELSTVVNSGFDDVILLGGLAESKDSLSKSGLPFLPDFLRSNSSTGTKSDILLLLKVKKI